MEKLMIEHEEFIQKAPVKLDFIAHWLDVYNNNKLSAYGITHSQAKILVRLSHTDDGRLPQSELKSTGRRGSTITSILSNLEKGGFITRSASESDARAKYISLTDKGRAAASVAFSNILELEELIYSLISEEEQQQLDIILEKITQGMKTRCRRERTDNT
ncbi:MAG: MarR family transcriptional regulator [Ruminococcus sp.]|nr:MarR family transcriptional regulator [Ruminococcus sp.]